MFVNHKMLLKIYSILSILDSIPLITITNMLILIQCWEEEILATERYTPVQELTSLPLQATFASYS